MEARFWYWHRDGWVRLKVRPGRPLEVYDGGPTDEGFRASFSTFSVWGGEVRAEHYTRERDCDGLVETVRDCWVRVDRLDAREFDDPETGERVAVPEWRTEYARQRDHAAESMGY
jgi:hypothetical protein